MCRLLGLGVFAGQFIDVTLLGGRWPGKTTWLLLLGHVVDVEEIPEMTMDDLYYIHLSATLARLQDPSSPRSERESLRVEAATHLRNYVNSIVANLSSGTSWTGDGWRGGVVEGMM